MRKETPSHIYIKKVASKAEKIDSLSVSVRVRISSHRHANKMTMKIMIGWEIEHEINRDDMKQKLYPSTTCCAET